MQSLLLRSCLCLLLFAGCSKPSDKPGPDDDGGTEVYPGEVRPTGEVKGTKKTAVIGPGGGSVTSADGNIKVNIPAGALTANTEIGVQAVTNTVSGGVGDAYRFTPHGQQFAKDIEIAFPYAASEDSIAAAYTLGVGYHHSDGMWYLLQDYEHNTATKTFSVKTNHFSDYSLLNYVYVTPRVKTVMVDDIVNVSAVRVVTKDAFEDGDKLIIKKGKPVDVRQPGMPIGVPKLLETKFIKRWYLGGLGTINVNGNQVVYHSPVLNPSHQTAAVTLELDPAKTQGQQVSMISTIRIEEGIVEMMNDEVDKWFAVPATCVKYGNSYYIGTIIPEDGRTIKIIWPGGSGSFNWTAPYNTTAPVSFQFYEKTTTVVESKYGDSPDATVFKASGGSFIVTSFGGVGQYVEGTFTLDPAGVFTGAQPPRQDHVVKLKGRFKVKRSS